MGTPVGDGVPDVPQNVPDVPPTTPTNHDGGLSPETQPPEKKAFPMTNFLLIWTFVVINAFIGICLYAFIATGSEPTTLIVATFSFFGFECGAMGAIKISSHKNNRDKGDDEQ